jgi:hypothetical protein
MRTKAERDELRAELDRSLVTWDAIKALSVKYLLFRSLDLLDEKDVEIERLRKHTDSLDKNWASLHNAAMNAIRTSLVMPDASVPEIIARIAKLEAALEKADDLHQGAYYSCRNPAFSGLRVAMDAYDQARAETWKNKENP